MDLPFANLPEQPAMGPIAEAYAAEILGRSRQVAASTRVALDQAYGGDPWQKLDLYLPADPALENLPVLIFLHGGGWSHGHKEWMGFMGPAFTDLPAIFVSVGYRLLPQHRHPAALDDTIAAIAWLHANIARYGGSPDRLFIGGHSAGGHLAALATLRRDSLAGSGLPPDVIKACFPVSAVCRFLPGELESREKFLLGRPEDAAEASPITHVAGNRTPFHLVWGDDDLPYVMRTCPEMVEALAAAGSEVTHAVLPDNDHFAPSVAGGDPTSPWVRTVREWMAKTP